jgi:DNA-binding LytR/AlgR family response regulator
MTPILTRLLRLLLVMTASFAIAAGMAAAQEVKQMQLSDAQVKSFITAQADLAAIASKIQAAGEKPDPALQAELETIAKKHGFKDFSELDDVAANISIVDPVDALQKELEDVKKDESIPEADKKQLVDELSEAIKTTPPLQHKENIDIVKTHRAEIEKALQ